MSGNLKALENLHYICSYFENLYLLVDLINNRGNLCYTCYSLLEDVSVDFLDKVLYIREDMVKKI